jgi:replicative DNA helicase
MQEITLDNRILKVGDAAREGFAELNKIQKKEKQILKTGEPMIDCHIGGLLPGDCILLAGAPSSGKSETLYRMIEKMMSEQVNPLAEKFVSLEYSMEMKMLNKLLRSSHNILGKKKSSILFEVFNEEEAKKIKEYYEGLQDSRRYVVQSPVTPEEFYKMTRDFCLLNADKEAILLSADHLLLFTGSDKQSVLEKVSEYVNLLKLEFNNIYFILLSQLNRSYNAMIKAKSNEMIPTNSLIFGSSFMEQLASYIVIITNPFKQTIDQYLKVSRNRYEYLEEFYGDVDKNDKVSFNTIGNLFFFVTKIRESDNDWKNLFIKKMDLSDETLNKMKESVSDTVTYSAPIFSTPIPVFSQIEEKPLPVVSFSDLKNAFDVPDAKEKPPF